MSHHEDDKHEKKKKQREKNRRDAIMFQQAALLRDNVDIGTPSTRHDKPSDKPAEKTTSDPGSKQWTTSIRNRLDNSRRASEDRWNRFAGTSDGGGRGR